VYFLLLNFPLFLLPVRPLYLTHAGSHPLPPSLLIHQAKGRRSQDAAAVLNNLGMAVSQGGRHEEAEKLCMEALAAYEQARGRNLQACLDDLFQNWTPLQPMVEKLASFPSAAAGQGASLFPCLGRKAGSGAAGQGGLPSCLEALPTGLHRVSR
jgi:hypothetical protein